MGSGHVQEIKAVLVACGMAAMFCMVSALHAADAPTASPEAKPIQPAATIDDNHPPFEEGISCNDCHAIKIDAQTTATMVWINGEYLKWNAGEGIMPKDMVWERIAGIYKKNNYKRTMVLGTALNNRPYTTTADYALDPDKKVLYGFHEKGTGKLNHIRSNPHVSLNWHREFDDNFANVLCIQVFGKAVVYEGTAKEFEEGLAVFPYQYAADARKISIEQWKEIVKKEMEMTKITIERVVLVEGALAPMNYRTTQEWTR